MAKIKLYQRNPAQQYVGVPQQDNSGAIIANAVASSANQLADQANQSYANDQYMARWMLNQASQDIGQAIRRQGQLNAKQQEYNDYTSAQDAITNFTMDGREDADRIQSSDPNAPENWASNFRGQATDRMNKVLETLTPGARKLAMGPMNNAIESGHGMLTTAGRNARTDLNDLAAQETALRIRDNAKIAGAKTDIGALSTDLLLFEKAAEQRLIKTPRKQVEKENIANKIAYLKDFAQAYSEAAPGQIEDVLQLPLVQNIIARIPAPELETLRRIDKTNVDQYMTELNIEDRKTKTAYERADYDRISPVFTQLQDKNSVDRYIGELIKMQTENDSAINDLKARDPKDLSEAQIGMFYARKEKINGWLEKLSKVSTDLGKKDETFNTRLTLNNEYNSKEAGAVRRELEQLEAQINQRGKLKAKDREAILDAADRRQKLIEQIETEHPTYLYEPTVDSNGRILPGDRAAMDRRNGQVDESVRRIQTRKSSGGTPVEAIKKLVGFVSEDAEKVATSPAHPQIVNKIPANQQNQFNQEVQRLAVDAAKKREQTSGKKTSPQQAAADKAFYESYLTQHPDKIPKPAPPKQKPATKNKSGLQPPPAPVGGMNIDEMYRLQLRSIPRAIIDEYLKNG